MNENLKQYEVLNWASLFLEENNCEANVATILLQHLLDLDQAAFYMNMRMPVDENIVYLFKKLIKEHVTTGRPVQHMVGHAYFYERRFTVNKDVLIPRQETEELVHYTLEKITNNEEDVTIVDVGTGSGVIGITLALENKAARLFATDISQAALRVAEHNVDKLGANVTLLHGDFLQPIINAGIKPDIVVSNPPYIDRSEMDSLSKTVKDFDPSLALFADDNGLAAYETIVLQIATSLPSVQQLFFEIGYEQAEQVMQLISFFFPKSKSEVIKDINGNDRIIHAHLSV